MRRSHIYLPNTFYKIYIHLRHSGPNLGRPYVDTLYGTKNSNIKELRFSASGGIWRVAFAFDFRRRAIVLVAKNKKGENQKRFYKNFIKIADSRFDNWLTQKDTNHGNDA